MNEIPLTENLIILGSTGSIGTQTLSLVKNLGIRVSAISGNTNVRLLEQQAREFGVKYVCAVDEKSADELRLRLRDADTRVLSGHDGLIEVATLPCDTVLNSVVGIAGLEPTLAAIDCKRKIALANKETLVAGGELVMARARENGVPILPVDSEHSAIFQSRESSSCERINRIILTASGGPFFGRTTAELREIKVEDALKHPNWSMGKKVTIDSATMMNKGLELIEAMWLFGVTADTIEIAVHRQSIVHSMVEFDDHSVIAQLGVPDMRIPIQYALTYPKRVESPVPQLDFFTSGSHLTFDRPDEKTFFALKTARESIKKGGIASCVMNAANEAAVSLFLDRKISFSEISEISKIAVEECKTVKTVTLEDILRADAQTRSRVFEKYALEN